MGKEEDYLMEGIGLRFISVKQQNKTEYDGTGGVVRFEFRMLRKSRGLNGIAIARGLYREKCYRKK